MAPPVEEKQLTKRPESVLVVVHTRDQVLLLRRIDDPDFWQSVTGSMCWDEVDPRMTAARELFEETGISATGLRDLVLAQRYLILPQWRARYAPNVSENVEHAYALLLARETAIAVSSEHSAYGWFGFVEAIAKVRSWSNRVVIEKIADERQHAT